MASKSIVPLGSTRTVGSRSRGGDVSHWPAPASRVPRSPGHAGTEGGRAGHPLAPPLAPYPSFLEVGVGWPNSVSELTDYAALSLAHAALNLALAALNLALVLRPQRGRQYLPLTPSDLPPPQNIVAVEALQRLEDRGQAVRVPAPRRARGQGLY